MDGVVVVFLFMMFFGLVVGLIVWGFLAAAKRRKALEALAHQWGMSFSEDDPYDIPNRFEAYAAIDRGHSRKASNVLTGNLNGRSAVFFDYHYTTGSGKNQQTHDLTALALELPGRWPRLLIRPENFFDKIAGVVGFDDIDFESDEFSKKFFVKCQDRKFAYDVIPQATMEYLLEREGWSMEFAGRHVLIWTDQTWEPEHYGSAAAVLEGFQDRVPEFVQKDMHERGA